MARSTTALATFVMAASLAVLGSACDNEVGRKCDLGIADPTASQAVVGSPSLDCQSKLCLKVPVDPAKAGMTPEGFVQLAPGTGMCTSTCESDSDCDKVPESPCVTGFTCGVAVTVGPFCCQKVCICKDYVVLPESGSLKTPATCDPGDARNACCNLDGRRGNDAYPNCPA
ncbi:MAG TPA: hypothetical protein VM734_03810 [Kofleriaceae bacterium]|jgi:hypothetical protein|nr:hypothetical protein [Kofleriaceae bacterium]